MALSAPTSESEKMQRLAPLWIGTQYYRAPTPTPDEWAADLKAIAEGGMDGVQLRLQWRWVERIRDEFFFDDHDELVKLCKRFGLTVIVKFICETAPDYIFHDLSGTRVDFHNRPLLPVSNGSMYVGGWYPDFSNPEVMHRAMNFVGRCVSRYKKEEHIVAWHLWNEPRSRPRTDMAGPHGLKLFRAWLQDRYKSIENFNQVFGKAWASFEAIALGDEACEHVEWFLWRKFCARRVADHLQKTRQAVLAADTSRPCLCHSGYNSAMQDPLSDISDDIANARAAERYGTSLVNFSGDCPDFSRLEGPASVGDPEQRRNMYITSLQCDWMRAMAAPKKFWLNEIYGNSWHGSLPDLDPQDLRWWMLDGVARGADGLLFWQYREERLANEVGCSGLVRVNGESTDRWEMVTKTVEYFKKLKPFLAAYRPAPAKIAIHHSPDTDLISAIADRPAQSFSSNTCHYLYKEVLKGIYSQFYNHGIQVDFTHDGEVGHGAGPDPVATPFWIVPDLRLVTPEMEAAFRTYVLAGGNLIAGPGLGERAPSLWLHGTIPTPNLVDLFGATQVGFPKATRVRMTPSDRNNWLFEMGYPRWAELRLVPNGGAREVLKGSIGKRQFTTGTCKEYPVQAGKRGKNKGPGSVGRAVLLGFYPGIDFELEVMFWLFREVLDTKLGGSWPWQIDGEVQKGPASVGGGRGRVSFHFSLGEKPTKIPHSDDAVLLVPPGKNPEGWKFSNQPGETAVVWTPEK